MKNISAALDSCMKTRSILLLITLVLSFLALPISAHIAIAQDVPAQSAGASQVSASDVEQYLANKYVIENIEARLGLGPHGISGSLHIRGDLTPKKPIIHKENKHDHARAIAEAFLAEEAVPLFGITNLTDIREFSISGDDRIYILYYRYVGNLRLEGTDIRIHIRPDGQDCLSRC